MNSVFASVIAPAAPGAGRGQQEEYPLARRDSHADGRGGVLVVTDRLERGAEAAAQEQEQRTEKEAVRPSVSQ